MSRRRPYLLIFWIDTEAIAQRERDRIGNGRPGGWRPAPNLFLSETQFANSVIQELDRPFVGSTNDADRVTANDSPQRRRGGSAANVSVPYESLYVRMAGLQQRDDLCTKRFGLDQFFFTFVPTRGTTSSPSGGFQLNDRPRRVHYLLGHSINFLFIFVSWLADDRLGLNNP